MRGGRGQGFPGGLSAEMAVEHYRGVPTLVQGQRHHLRSWESLKVPLQGTSKVPLTLGPEKPRFKPSPAPAC